MVGGLAKTIGQRRAHMPLLVQAACISMLTRHLSVCVCLLAPQHHGLLPRADRRALLQLQRDAVIIEAEVELVERREFERQRALAEVVSLVRRHVLEAGEDGAGVDHAAHVRVALRHRAGVSAMVMTPDRSCLISAGADDQLLLVSLVTPTATAAAATHDAVQKAPVPRVRNLCAFVSLSNNLQSAAAVLADLDVLVWRVQGLKDGAWDVDIMAKLKNDPSATPSVGHTAGINTCRFSADDTRLCTASRDKSLRLWDLQGDETRRFTGHQGDVIAADFSPDGKLVAAGDSNKLLRVWDASGLARQAERAKAEGHRKSILCVAWAAMATRHDTSLSVHMHTHSHPRVAARFSPEEHFEREPRDVLRQRVVIRRLLFVRALPLARLFALRERVVDS